MITGTCNEERILPEGRRCPRTVVGLKFLHDVIAARKKLAHVIPIEKINETLLATPDQQMRWTHCLVGQKDRSAGAEIAVHRIEKRLIERSEVIRQG